MSDLAGEEIRFLLERARVVGRIADHLAPVRPAEPARVVVQADSPAFAADFAADIAAAARLRGRHLIVDVGRGGEAVSAADEVVLLTPPEDATGEQEATIVVSFDAQGRPALERLGLPETPVHLFLLRHFAAGGGATLQFRTAAPRDS